MSENYKSIVFQAIGEYTASVMRENPTWEFNSSEAQKCGEKICEIFTIAYDKLKEELAEARAELAIAKSLPLIGAGHYKSELDIHVKESLAFVKQAAEKIDALTAERDSLRTESRLLEELSNTSDLSGRVHLIEKLKKTRDKRESGGSWFCDKCQVAVSPHHNHECPPSPTQESE
jgi:hypothetical protein